MRRVAVVVTAFYSLFFMGVAAAAVPSGSVYGDAENLGGAIHVGDGKSGEWISEVGPAGNTRAVQVNATVEGNASIRIEAIDGSRVADSTRHDIRPGSHTYPIEHPTANRRMRVVVDMKGPVTVEGIAYTEGPPIIDTENLAVNAVLWVIVGLIGSVTVLVWRRKRKNVIGERWEPGRVEATG